MNRKNMAFFLLLATSILLAFTAQPRIERRWALFEKNNLPTP